MKVLPTFGILLGLIGAKSAAFARLGETPVQCTARYGTIVVKEENERVIKYAKDMLRVECFFDQGKCVFISYALAPVGVVETHDYTVRFSEDDKAVLLLANQGVSKFIPWKPDFFVSSGTEAMKTTDGKVRAFLGSSIVHFEMADYVEKRRAALAPEAIKNSLKGF